VRAPHCVRQRREPVARARAHAPARDGRPARDRIEPAPFDSTTAHRRPVDGRHCGRVRNGTGRVGRASLRPGGAGGGPERAQQLLCHLGVRQTRARSRRADLRARHHARHNSRVRAGAGHAGVAARARDRSEGKRSRQRPAGTRALDARGQRSRPRLPAAHRVGVAHRKLRAHPESPDRIRVRRCPDVLGAASRLALRAGRGTGDGRSSAHAHSGGARRRIGGGEPLYAVHRLFAEHRLFSRPSGRSRQRARRRTTTSARSAFRCSRGGRSRPPIAPARRRSPS